MKVAGGTVKVMVWPDSLISNVESKIDDLTKQMLELSLIVRKTSERGSS